jgi:hypothetical protein
MVGSGYIWTGALKILKRENVFQSWKGEVKNHEERITAYNFQTCLSPCKQTYAPRMQLVWREQN